MFGNSAPPSPDFTGAAQTQAAAGRQLATEQTYANRPDITTPWGGVRWTPPAYDPRYGTGGGPGGGAPGAASESPTPEFFGGGPGDIAGPEGFRQRQAQGGQVPTGQVPAPGGLAPAAPGRWGMELFLSPEQQAALEAQQRLTSRRSGLAETMFERARGELGGAPDWGSLPEAPTALGVGGARDRAESALYSRATRYLDPQWQQRQEQADAQLRNQGLLPGSAAYEREMGNLERQREAAYGGAREAAITGGGAEATREFGLGLQGRQQALAEMLQRRGWTLNEIQALLSGQQVGMPGMPSFAPAGVSAPPNLLGAATAGYGADLNAYNAQQAQLQAMLSGLSGIGALPFKF